MLFGQVIDAEFTANDVGAIVAEEWLRSADIREEIALDSFVVMPNHFHAVVWITDRRGDRPVAPTVGSRVTLAPRSLGSLMAGFKSAVTKRVNELHQTPGAPLWQRNYYERVIRDDDELNRIREYIQLNPLKWSLDRDNPDRTVDDAWDHEWKWLEGDPP